MAGRVPGSLRALVAAFVVAGALTNCTPASDDRGGAASGDDLESSSAGSAASNEAVQRGKEVNDTLPGRDSRVQDGTDTSQGQQRP